MVLLKKILLLALVLSFALHTTAQNTTPMSERMAATILRLHPDSLHYAESIGKSARWNYENGVVLNAIENLWLRTGNGAYFKFIQKNIDAFVHEDGTIRTFDMDEFNLDNIPTGRLCLTLYQVTGKEKYKKAADKLCEQLRLQPRTVEGGFWHKKKYVNQMWLDGLYMAEPFYAEYAVLFKEEKNFDDIANQFVYMEKHSRDTKTGLLFHGWDESKKEKWANKNNGCSPMFWGRAMGWYALALVDVLDYFPENHPRRKELVSILQRLAPAILNVQDAQFGIWYNILDSAGVKGNYLEASASGMFVASLAKGVRQGFLDKKYLAAAQRGYEGMLKNFVTENADGSINLEKTVNASGLGGTPYRDGSYAYYMSEFLRQNDLKGVGPFINASIEIERAKEAHIGKGKTVLIDYFFNNEYRKGFDGQQERFHYTLNDRQNSGFYGWGSIFNQLGAQTKSLETAPSEAAFKSASVYIIVDPDTKKETDVPHFVESENIEVIKKWAEAGGTLVLMANDTGNCEIPHFNKLAEVFGIRFSDKAINFVKNDKFEQGQFLINENPILKTARKIYIKELSVLTLTNPAEAVLNQGTDIILATSKYGKGRIFAVGDPWFYNEYIDGRKLPADFDNFKAAKDLARWLLSDNGQ